MAKAELGIKRVCLSVICAFMTLIVVIICPGCGAKFDPQRLIKSKKLRTPQTETKVTEATVEADNVTESMPVIT